MQDLLHSFIASAKPDWMTALDFAVIVRLMSETTPDQPITWLARDTIAKQTGVSERSVSRSLDVLIAEKWIKKTSGKRQYNQNRYEVLYVNLPTEQKAKTIISDEAKALTVIYRDLFLRHHTRYVNRKGRPCSRPLRKDWKDRWSYAIQVFLNEGNTPDFITRVFNWASANKPKAFRAGPQGLKAVWPKGVTK